MSDGKFDSGRMIGAFLGSRPLLKRMLRRIVPSVDIDDIVQETFIRAHEAQMRKHIDHPKAYIFKTARNLALNFIAKKEHSLSAKLEDFAEADVYLEDLAKVNAIESKEKFRLFCAAVRGLPPQCRRAFILKRVFGFTIREISIELGISESTTEKHVAKGVLCCADFLKENGYEVTARSKHPIRKDA